MTKMQSTRKTGRTRQDPAWVQWIDRLSILSAGLGAIAAFCLMLNVVLDVAARFLLNSQLSGTIDLTQYAWMPTLISLGLGYALLRGEHIRVSLLTVSAGFRAQRVVEVLAMVVTFFVVTLLLWYATDQAIKSTRSGEGSVGTAWLEVWPFRWAIVLGFGVLLLQTVATLWRMFATRLDILVEADEVVTLPDGPAILSDAPARSDAGARNDLEGSNHGTADHVSR